MNLFEEAKQAMEEISQEADFFEKAKKKKSRLSVEITLSQATAERS